LSKRPSRASTKIQAPSFSRMSARGASSSSTSAWPTWRAVLAVMV
jgi:hypothetical protein